MASPMVRLRGRAWVERARIAGLAARILETERFLMRGGDGALTHDEARILRALADRLGAVPP